MHADTSAEFLSNLGVLEQWVGMGYGNRTSHHTTRQHAIARGQQTQRAKGYTECGDSIRISKIKHKETT